MKKLHKSILIVVILAFIVTGCAQNGVFCKNKNAIINGLNVVVATATILKPLVPSNLQFLVVLLDESIKMAQDGLAKNCPTEADLIAAQTKLDDALKVANALGVKLALPGK